MRFGGGNHRGTVPFLLPHIKKSTCYQRDLLLLILTTLTLISCLRYSTVLFFFFFFLSCCLLWKEDTMNSPHSRSGELCPTSWKVQYLHSLFGILLPRRFISPHIYLLSQSIIYISIDSYSQIFFIWGFFFLVLSFWVSYTPQERVIQCSAQRVKSSCQYSGVLVKN